MNCNQTKTHAPQWAAVLALAALTLTGCRELTNPKGGFLIVADTGSPVLIQTRDLEGAGYINALNTDRQWTPIHFSPGGAFTFNQPLPAEAWHCKRNRGCVAALRVGDEKGFFATPKMGRIYVCTGDYLQSGGRKRCGPRSMEIAKPLPSDPLNAVASFEWGEAFPHPTKSEPVEPHDLIQNWQGDGAQRLFSGFHEWDTTGNPWEPANPGDVSGSWQEFGWRAAWGATPLADRTFVSGDMYSVDLGVSRVFIPWSGEHYIEASESTGAIRTALGGLGLAEILIDRLRENPISQSIYTQDAIKWLNVLNEINDRSDKSPEFHFRVTGDGERQMCLVQFVRANNKINGKPDAWFRFDQGFAALFIQWFGLGDCPTHSARIQYCGALSLDDGAPNFTIDPDTVRATLEPYPKLRPLCNNRFKPEFESRIPEMLIEPAQIAITEGLALLVGSFEAVLGASVRRFEITPTGIYLVLAETVLDPQYGIGDSTAELEKPAANLVTQPDVTLSSVPATGITRPIQ